MTRPAGLLVFLCFLMFLLLTGLVPGYVDRARLAADIRSLEVYLLKAQTAEGSICVPDMLAAAQAYLARAKEEYEEGDYWEAEDAAKLCRETSESLWDKILVCGEDLDRDGIPDLRDRCRDEPETYNGYQEADGCPDRVPARAVLAPGKIEILEPLRFDQETQELIPGAVEPVLRDVAALMRENPQIRIRIEAHADSSLTAEQSSSLCARRAENVRAALVAEGVDAARLETADKGAGEPIAPNDSALGRMLNRRIEFVQIP
ncbi:MAG: OmpA family protein [bacterium]